MTYPFIEHNGKVMDSQQIECTLYPDVLEILTWVKEDEIPVALASRVRNIAGATLLLRLFNIRHHFWPVEIYPTSKVLHFQQIKKKTGLEFEEMLFFDDDIRNLRNLTPLNIPCVHVVKGLKSQEFFKFVGNPNRIRTEEM